MRLFDLLFSSLLQPWYFEVRISRSVSESPLEFEITRVDCIYKCSKPLCSVCNECRRTRVLIAFQYYFSRSEKRNTSQSNDNAPSRDPDPAYPNNLINHRCLTEYSLRPLLSVEGPTKTDQSAEMHRLV